jgi:hypothetical protein
LISARLGLLLVGAAAVSFYALKGKWTEPEVAFTRPAPAAPASLDLRPVVSTLHLTIPVDLGRVARRADAAIEQRLALGLAPETPDAACVKRPQAAECTQARIDGTITRTAPARATLGASSVRIAVPLRIETVARPGEAGDRQPQSLMVGFSFSVRSAPGGGFAVARIEDPASEAAGDAARLRTTRQLEARLRQAALAVQDELQQTLARVPVVTATQRAWAALAQPVQLGLGSGAVLNAQPEIAGSGELVAQGAQASVRVPISVRLAVGPADNSTGTVTPRPLLTGVVPSGDPSRIRMAVPLRLDGLQNAARAELVKAGTVETRPDRFGPPVKVTVHGVRVYTAMRQIAFELDATAKRFEGQAFRGKAHLSGRPVLDAERALVSIADLTFPPLPPRDLANPQLPANAPRLASEPFAGIIAGVSRIAIDRELADVVPQAMNLLQQRLGEHLSMTARLGAMKPVSVETSRDSMWLVGDIAGELTLIWDGPHDSTAGAAVATTGARNSAGGGPNMPDASSAAVVPAAAASVAAAAASRSFVTPAAAPAQPVLSPGRPTTTAARATADDTPARGKAVVVKPRQSANRPARRQSKGSEANSRRDWIPFSGN